MNAESSKDVSRDSTPPLNSSCKAIDLAECPKVDKVDGLLDRGMDP